MKCHCEGVSLKQSHPETGDCFGSEKTAASQ
jgi:hypothetical protein